MMHMRFARVSALDNPGSITKESAKRAWTFIRKYRRVLFVFVLLIGVGNLLALTPPLITKAIVDKAIPTRSISELYLLTGLFFIVNLSSTALGVASRWISARMGEGLIFDLRVALFRHFLRLPISFYTASQTGSVVSRINNDVLGSQQAITIVSNIFSDVVNLTFVLIVMTKLSPLATLVALAVAPFLIIADRSIGKKIAPLARNQMNANAETSSFSTERLNISGALLVKLFGSLGIETNRYERRVGNLKDAGIRLAVAGRLYNATISTITGLGTVGVYLVAGRFAVEHTLTIGTLVALAQYSSSLYAPITDLASVRVSLSQSLVSFDRVSEVLSLESDIVEADDPKEIPNPAGRVSYNNVSFKYKPFATPFAVGDSPSTQIETTLKGLDLTIEAGEMCALVGPSGAGKSTIASLLSRLYDPTEGSITIDGIDIKELSSETLGNLIGVVSQETFLFHDSIASNLRYAKPDATMDELIEATKGAQIYQRIMEMPDGFDTVVGERGYRLSGGERQRLAIARVFLKRPVIVVLDEATSHLDAENELAVQVALNNLLQGRTSLVIAHRLSTIVNADQIIVVKAGEIVERGDHRELLSRGGIYRDLFDSQLLVGEEG